MPIIPLQPAHWEDAAALVVRRVREVRDRLPMLPTRYETVDAIYPLLAELAGRAPGVAALDGARLVGFLTAMALPSIKGKRGTFSPEWAHGVIGEAGGAGARAGAVYQALYAALAPAWLANGCYVHAVRILAHDRVGRDAFYWQGFGLNNVDAIRDLSPLTATVPNLQVRQATASDIDAIAALGEGLQRHLAAPPIYLPLRDLDSREDHLAWLAAPGHVQWLAVAGGAVVAELRLEPTNDTACVVAADAHTTFITSAYTLPAARNGGVAAALLAHAVADARTRGYVRVVTDFESANIPGAAFWMHHFQPLAYSVVRYIDERSAFAHAGRRLEDIW